MPRPSRHVQELASIFHVMGDLTRLKILINLQDGPKSVTKLVKKLKMPQPTVSHHLALLRMAGLVSTRKSGREVFYSIGGGALSSPRAVRAAMKGAAGFRVGRLVCGLVED